MESPPVVALPWLTVNIVQFFPAVTNDFLFLCLGLRLPFVSPSPLFPRLVVPPTFGHEANE